MIRPLAWPRLVGIGQDSQHNRTVAVPLSVTAFRAGGAGPLCYSTYRELPGAGAGPVACVWIGRPGWSPRSLRLLPDGCVDVVWDGTAIAVVPPRAAAVRHNLTARGFSAGVRLRAGWAAQTLRTSIGPLPAVANMADVRPDAGVPQLAEALAGLSDPVVAAWLLARWVEWLRPAGSVPETRLRGPWPKLPRCAATPTRLTSRTTAATWPAGRLPFWPAWPAPPGGPSLTARKASERYDLSRRTRSRRSESGSLD